MGNYICALIILAAVLIFTAINSYIICSVCDEMIALIDSGQQDEAVKLWESKRDYIALFVRDAEIDVVNAEAEALGAVSVEDGEAEAGIIRLRDAVTELKNSEYPNFQTIFCVDINEQKVYYNIW